MLESALEMKTIKDIAESVNVSKTSVYNLIKSGKTGDSALSRFGQDRQDKEPSPVFSASSANIR